MSRMNWSLNACNNYRTEDTISEKDFVKSSNLKQRAAQIFQSSRALQKFGWNKDKNFFREVWDEATDKDFLLHEMTASDLKKFKWELGDREMWFDRGIGKHSSAFKVLEANLKRIPGGRDLRRTINKIAAYHRQHTKVNNDRISRISVEVKDMAKDLGINLKELEKREAVLQAAKTTAEKNEALYGPNGIEAFLGSFNSGGARTAAGDLFLSVRDVMENTPIETLKRRNPNDPTEMIPWDTKNQQRLRVIRDNWFEMRKDLVGVLKNALRSERRIIANIDRTEGGSRRLTEYLDRIDQYIDNIEFREATEHTGRSYEIDGKESHEFGLNGKKIWNLESQLGYMPHYILTITKDLQKFNDFAHNTNDRRTAFEVFEDQIRLFESGNGVINRVKSRAPVNQEYYSRNPFLFLSKYMHEVSSYNHANSLKESMQGVFNKFIEAKRVGEDLGESDSVNMFIDQASKVLNTLQETSNMTGHKPNTWGDKISRGFTSLAFFRTMGFNIRSAIRNGGQQLIERIHLGYGVRRSAKKYLADTGLNVGMEYQATRHGILWTTDQGFLTKLNKAYRDVAQEGTKGSMEEGFLLPGLKEVVNPDGSKHIEMVDATLMDKLFDMVDGVASKSAVLHTMVENMNRFGSFRVGYATAHQNLSKAPEWYIEREMGKEVGTTTSEQRKQWIDTMAGELAYNVVTDVHFEYGKHEKAPIMTGKVGRVLTQFQHYRFELTNLQFNWIKKGLRDIVAGDAYHGVHSRQMLRMGMTYGIISALTSMTGLGLVNLLSNDNYEWLKNHLNYYTSERHPEGHPKAGQLTEAGMKQAERATFGAGSWSDLGPTVGGLLEFGNLMGIYKADLNSWLPMVTAADTESTGTMDEEDRAYKMKRLFSIQGARTFDKTSTAVFNQHWYKAFLIETGLYVPKDIKKRSNTFWKWARDITGIPTTGRSNKFNVRRTGSGRGGQMFMEEGY